MKEIKKCRKALAG